MLSMEHYSEMLLLLLFLISMLGSIERSDLNSTFSLFAYMFLASYRYRTALDNVLNILMITTMIVIGADAWAFVIMIYEPISGIDHLMGYTVIAIEVVLKILLMVMFACWRFDKSGKN
jgi:hypothetical protein